MSNFCSLCSYVVTGCTGSVEKKSSSQPIYVDIDVDDGPVDVSSGGKGLYCTIFFYFF